MILFQCLWLRQALCHVDICFVCLSRYILERSFYDLALRILLIVIFKLLLSNPHNTPWRFDNQKWNKTRTKAFSLETVTRTWQIIHKFSKFTIFCYNFLSSNILVKLFDILIRFTQQQKKYQNKLGWAEPNSRFPLSFPLISP